MLKLTTYKLPVKNYSLGFTLMEILIVIGILTIVAAFSAVVSLQSYTASGFWDERDVIVSLLQKARSQSVNNVCLGAGCSSGKAHGVHFETGRYVLFQGASYNSSDPLNEVMVSENPTVTVTAGGDIVFNQLDGSTAGDTVINLSDSGTRNSQINVNTEGRINW